MSGAEILLVEDDELNQALVPAILARSGEPVLRAAHVTAAGTLARARAILAGGRIDLVLLDFGLPDGNGLLLAEEMCGRAGPATPVIVISGAPAEHADEALAAGCVAVLGKPYTPAQLCAAVLAHLGPGLPDAAPGAVTAAGRAASAPEATAAPAPAAPPAPVPAAADFGLLLRCLPGRYLALDPGLTIVAASDAYAEAIQATAEGLIGRDVQDALPGDPEGAAALRASLDRVRRDLMADTMAVRKLFIPPADAAEGAYQACHVRPVNMPVTGPGGELRYLIHWLEDVTGQVRETEQARQARQEADDAKTEYISRVSHELRTPINTILGFGELLSLGDLTAEHREWAAMIVKAARHLAAFMDDVADVSRAQASKLSLSLEPAPAGAVIADALDLIRPLAASHGVHLDPAPPASQHVVADQRRLRQVLLNLLSNAVKYNHPAGRVTVTVAPQDQDRLRISVCDTGRGIAEYDIGQLFTPFQRLDAAQAGIEGAGLGLTLSRQLIEAMGGTVGATSAPGQGSVFWVDLPSAEPAAAAGPAAGDPLAEPRAYTAAKTILYVEDMLETLMLVEHVLRQRPSTALVPAMLGGVALDLAAEYRPDLILLDLNLPDLSGEELLARFRSDPATSATPIVIISADAAQERIDGLIAAGAAAYLTKPISVQGFLRTIDGLLTGPAASGQGRIARHEIGVRLPADGQPGGPVPAEDDGRA